MYVHMYMYMYIPTFSALCLGTSVPRQKQLKLVEISKDGKIKMYINNTSRPLYGYRITGNLAGN